MNIELTLDYVDLSSSFENTKFELIKPHGACNLYNASVCGTRGSVSMDALNVFTNGNICSALTDLDFVERIENNAFPPVMSYFEANKATTSGLSFIEQQRANYANTILEADKIIIVGVAYRPSDTHIWGPLAKTEARILNCSGELSKEYKEWSKTIRKCSENDINLNSFFRDGFEIICDFAELE